MNENQFIFSLEKKKDCISNNTNNNDSDDNFFTCCHGKFKFPKNYKGLTICFLSTITIMNILILLFVIQGLFGLSSSFILLYTSGDRVLQSTRQYQQFQTQVFINHELTEFISSTSLMAEHVKYQLQHLPLDLKDDILWLRLFQYFFTIYSSQTISALYFAKRNDDFIIISNEYGKLWVKNNNYTNYLFWREIKIDQPIGYDFFETHNVTVVDNVPFYPTSRVWFKVYLEKDNIYPKWTDIFINVRNEWSISLTMPVYIKDKIISNETFLKSPIYEDKLTNPNPDNLYGVFAIQLRLSGIHDFLNTTFSQYSDLDFVMIINSKANIVAKTSSRNNSNVIEKKALEEIDKLNLLSLIKPKVGVGPPDSIYVSNETHFSLTSEFGVTDVQFTIVTDFYGLDWAVVIGVPSRSFVKEIFISGSGITSLIVFIIVFVLGMLILFLIVFAVSSRLQKLTKRVVDLVHFRGMNKKEKRLSIFYDIRNMQQSMKAMKRGIKTFSKYVPEIIVKQVIKRDSMYGKIGMKLQNMSVLFSEIIGFTLLAEKTDTTTFLSIMTEYFSAMCQVIEDNQGLVDKFIGDAILALFNEMSFPIKNHEIHACKSALDSFHILNELNSRWRLCGYPELDIHIGINSGNMLCGNIGAENRMNFTVIGDAVNIASRLEVLNNRFYSNILIGEDTYNKVKDKFICYFVDYVVVKGKDKAICVYSLICDRMDANISQIEMCESMEKIKDLLLSFEFKKMTEMCEELFEKTKSKLVENLLNRSVSLQILKETLPEINLGNVSMRTN
ncbi:hypothetical protein ABK040_005070 [Willaertia magna]